ncbi:type I restriction-modification system endonuclease [Leptolyngbya sp. FACHB-261]|uniref:type I restriction-modification system endonuclease n=1 Tax=Leptolyngbya sp. FACHB-261 TaxID=2692806 RepID=UPI0016855C32|nr:type I restriction-modification system endonuclease [Leptolyngbya sp. FACHB-261]MBD2101778.1 type I restriction-modification system endonuclease [Leptolyngbya sp. FACHB-261]
MIASQNFAFLQVHDTQLVRLGTLAEQYFVTDPNTCLIKLRQFSELLAQLVAARVGLYLEGENQVDLLRRLRDEGLLNRDAGQLFYELRVTGNKATHALSGDHRSALSCLKYARELGIWFHKSFSKERNFKPGPFIPPPDPRSETQALKQELERLRAEAQVARTMAEAAQASALEEAQLREVAEELLIEAEAKAQEVQAHLVEIQAQATREAPQAIQQVIRQAQQAETEIVLDEAETRRLIDRKLQAAGWEADSEQLTFANGIRPQKGKNLAIAEWPTQGGRADYALFVGLEAVAVVEAKRRSKDVSADIDQAKRYSRTFQILGNETLSGGPWREFKVPFVFATNGREYLKQLRTKSGIWFCDLRRPENLRYPLNGWYTPKGLLDLLAQDVDQAQAKLAQEDFNYDLKLREYQIKAIQATESALAEGRRELLLAMATGTGKTKTCIALVYRLLKTKRFRRVLFLVDRTALGEQTDNAFKESRMESLQSFSDIFDVKGLKDATPEAATRVQISTVQAFVKRILYASDERAVPPVDQYDCIVIDECHRGYLLDRELSDTELSFRDADDYISKYRRVLEHFDAVKIGLTATPALHTTEIFGPPIYQYSYREAVIDGHLIDHEPPFRIETKLSQEGIVWKQGDSIAKFDPKTGKLDLANAPDEVKLEVEQFNRRVITQEFNRVVCEALASYLDPALPEKTLVFCVDDNHADLVVDQLKTALANQYGSVEDDAVLKITGKADQPLQLIRRFRNEQNPKIAVTVDLLTTGIDVPSICNLVFLRRVNSRILYEQMLGRATRLCPDIGKQVFRIFDAVDLYAGLEAFTNMKPVVVDPKISFAQLVEELGRVQASDALALVVDQLLVKLQRKRQSMSPEGRAELETLAGMPLDEMVSQLRQAKPDQVQQWFQGRESLAVLLDQRREANQPILVSYHVDELQSISRGYGVAGDGAYRQRPADYLDDFKRFLTQNQNEIAALLVVTQRPRELTRAQLRELRLLLDRAGYSEQALRSAWQDVTNQDIAASIIGFIRQAALGDALVPYEERVDRALKKILTSRAWTPPQRQWLERIGKQLKVETIVDREALDQGMFKVQGGGFERLNRTFEGKLEEILVEINDALWQSAS